MLALGRDVLDDGGEEVGGGEDFEVALGVPTAAGAVDDGLGGGVPMDFLEGEGARNKYSARRWLPLRSRGPTGAGLVMEVVVSRRGGRRASLGDEFGPVEGVGGSERGRGRSAGSNPRWACSGSGLLALKRPSAVKDVEVG